MVHNREIAALEQTKQLLVTQCEMHRVVLALQLNELQSRAGHFLRALQRFKRSAWLLLPAGMAAGLLLTRRPRPMRKGLVKLLLGWTLLRRAKPLWTILRFVTARR